MKKTILCMLVAILLYCSCSSFDGSDKRAARHTTNLKIANVLLSYAGYDIDLLDYCRQNLGDNTVLISKIEESLYMKLSEVSSTSPTIDKLGGTPLNVLASIINYQNDNVIYYSGPLRNKIVDDYLTLITDSLLEQKDKFGRIPTSPLMKFYKDNEEKKK